MAPRPLSLAVVDAKVFESWPSSVSVYQIQSWVPVADWRASSVAWVADVSYDALGCSISQASASVMTDLVIGKPVDEAMAIHEEFLNLMQGKGQVEPDEEVLEDGIAFAGVARFPARIKCALLSWMAWKDATLSTVGPASPVEPVGTEEETK